MRNGRRTLPKALRIKRARAGGLARKRALTKAQREGKAWTGCPGPVAADHQGAAPEGRSAGHHGALGPDVDDKAAQIEYGRQASG